MSIDLDFLFKKQNYFFKENKKMKIFSGQVFEVKADTTRSELLWGLKKFGIFSDVEFECKDQAQGIFFVREVGMLERLGKMFHSVLSKDIYHASGDALLQLSKKNVVLAGVLGRSVFDAQEKLVSVRELNDRLRLGEKKFKLMENSVRSVPTEGKLIVTDALSMDFGSVNQVDLTQALTQENFRDACNAAFAKARKKYPAEVLIVKLSSVSDNDEPSDEAINRLLLVIDEHHQSDPSGRLLIATDGDHLLYERILNLKIQHDAKKASQSNSSNLNPMDLFMIPAHGDELAKLDPIDENGLEKFTTQFDNVSVCIMNYPEMIQSDLSILNSNTLSPSPQNPEDKPAEASKLIRSISELRQDLEIGVAFKNEKNRVSEDSTLFAARFPTMDLPIKRLIVFERLRAGWPPKHTQYETNVEKVKSFYLKELRKERGRVVIESPDREYACEGLRKAVEELRNKKEGPDEIIITAYSGEKYIFEKFAPSTPSGLNE